MRYELRQYDKVLATFELNNIDGNPSANNLSINQANAHLLPLNFEPTNDGVINWLKTRTIPKNRAYADNFLSNLGLSIKDVIGIAKISKCLSLLDAYWVVEDGYQGNFKQNNLFENRLSAIFSEIAFTGYGSVSNHSLHSSPEFTTNGMFPKAWRRYDGKLQLFKAGTKGFSNSGKESYSEFYAYQIAKTMGLNAVEYNLKMWKGDLCATCVLFTDINHSFIPAGALIKNRDIKSILEYYKNLGDKYYNDLLEMFLLDAVICNTDRHTGNFGFMIDNKTNKIIDTAPIFDNGLSLFCYAVDDNIDKLADYAKTRNASLYQDFVTFIKPLMTKDMKIKLRKLINFEFEKHSRYNLPKKRLKKIEEFIQNRIQELLE